MKGKTTRISSASEGNVKILNPKDLNYTDKQRVSGKDPIYAQYIRMLLQNWRQGTVGVKDRSEVSLTNRKPWKQKGTGRARAGTARSPLWRKGGVTFGPQERVKTLKLPKQMRQQVCAQLFWNYLDNKRILSLDWSLDGDSPKTSSAYKSLIQAGLQDKKVILFLTPEDRLAQLSFANIPNVRILFFDAINAFDLSNCDYWVLLSKDWNNFKEMVDLWI